MRDVRCVSGFCGGDGCWTVGESGGGWEDVEVFIFAGEEGRGGKSHVRSWMFPLGLIRGYGVIWMKDWTRCDERVVAGLTREYALSRRVEIR